MKKVLSLILAFTLLLALCACGNKQDADAETTGGQKDGTTEATQNSKKPTDPTRAPDTKPSDTQVTTPTDAPTTPTETQDTNPTETPTDPTEAPTDPTEAPTTPTGCSHSYKDATCTAPKTCTKCGATEGNALGHTWQNATCKAPKTCSVCKLTEGSVGTHNFVDGSCTVCNATDSINPKENLKICGDITEEYVAKVYSPYDEHTISAPGVSFYNDGGYGEGIYCILLDAMFSSNPEDLDEFNLSRPPVSYNNKNHYRIGAGQSPAYVELTDTEIIITNNGNTIKMIMTGDGNLKVTASSDSRFAVGTVLSTAWSFLKPVA